MTQNPAPTSVWEQLKNRKIDCSQALKLLVNEQGIVNQVQLDQDVSSRFFHHFPERSCLPPVMPLLLWQGCYHLGAPVTLDANALKLLRDRTRGEIKVIPIAEESYNAWFRTQNLNNPNSISSTQRLNPLTGKLEQEDISETTGIYLAKAEDQIGRIKTLLSGALRNRASDIHLEPMPDGLRVRYRIDGVLRDIITLPGDVSRKVVVALKVMSNMDISESRRPQDGRIGENYASGEAERAIDMRVSLLPCVNGEKAVIRLLPRDNPFSQMQDLGFSPATLPTYKNWLEQPQGMIILTGPTGSGKTSTLYTSLQAVAQEHVNVVTVEDPVEYVLPGITQTQVHEAAGMTFSAGLRAILRQDPDIIMVGEIRDSETAQAAVRAALTGHLVFTTLHTNNAVGAIPRLKDIGPDPGLLSDALLGIVAQRLVRRICPDCAQPHMPTSEELQALGLELQETDPAKWRRGKGCSRCFNSGYLGREAVVELLDIDDLVREIIYEGTMTQLHRYLQSINFASFRIAAIEKVTSGVTTVEEVLRVIPKSALSDKSSISNGLNASSNSISLTI